MSGAVCECANIVRLVAATVAQSVAVSSMYLSGVLCFLLDFQAPLLRFARSGHPLRRPEALERPEVAPSTRGSRIWGVTVILACEHAVIFESLI